MDEQEYKSEKPLIDTSLDADTKIDRWTCISPIIINYYPLILIYQTLSWWSWSSSQSLCYRWLISFHHDRLTELITKLKSRVETLDHHFEHQLSSVEDHIKNLLGKLNEREDKSEKRIKELEEIVKRVLLHTLKLSQHYTDDYVMF